ncbi:MAG: hypothetical protein M3Z33_01600 [Actinomycetota bacterium]|nr:hypothetical protein [Actinomycetota bacterium]
MAYELTQDDLITHLREQVDFLRSSAAAYDQGEDAEAERLAITLRTLLHNTSDSPSVLEQLGEQQPLAFVDTAPALNPRNLLSFMGLLTVESSHAGARWVAMPRGSGHSKPFDAWWNDTVVKDSNGEEFSRKGFVLGLANDGNPDPTRNDERARSTARDVGDSDPPELLANPAPSVVRQIAYEVLETLKQLPYVVGI